ncbi:MurR/RpiR family transcriptional regulator [Lacticaseibacillus baoqingensis]|uniref:MurR/RpiR family transcriptional regulator n=1 Tax=Lacticaseibacillus baoqingensis TaxID=2486013 RepID=A0ABW4E6D2_9LACO|nr:MurR/RpiR family transcriptional regulator [Lacticaseibacillus baoqingensis]
MLFLNYTPELTETDMTIYREIVKDMDAVIYMRIRDLAETTYCSTASIQRFCQKFDCSGWAEFKAKLRMYNNQMSHRGQLPNDIDGGEITRSIAACEDGQYQQAMDRAAHLLYEHAQVVWIGFGTSRIVAEYGAATYSNSVNLSFSISAPMTHPQVDYPEAVYKAMCAVVCSVSGENRVVIGYLNELIKHQVPVIAITNSANSTIARLATVALAYYVTPQDLDGANLTSQTPAIYIIEKITRRAMMLARPENVRHLEDNVMP